MFSIGDKICRILRPVSPLLRIIGFPKPGSYCKTGFFGFGKGQTRFSGSVSVLEVTSLHSLQIGGGVTSSNILTELLITLSRRSKIAFNLLPCLPGIERVTALKILGITITGKLSMSEHVRDVVRKCAQSLHIIRVLRCRGMNDQALQDVYRSVVIAKLLNAACA